MNGYERISRYKAHLMGLAVMVVVYGHLLYYHSGLQNYEDVYKRQVRTFWGCSHPAREVFLSPHIPVPRARGPKYTEDRIPSRVRSFTFSV